MSNPANCCTNPWCEECYGKPEVVLPERDPREWDRANKSWVKPVYQNSHQPECSLDYKSGWFDGYHAAKNSA
jgi:hypothetical protein